MNRLICVSNRVGPLADSAKAGGLAVGLVDALKENGGVWFGWSGDVTEQGTFGPMKLEEQGKVSLATIDISPVDYAEFYAGYTNRTLWPLFHYRLDIADYDRRFEEAYRRVNQRFAARLKPLIKPSDVIWVHDYHFLLLGCELRELGIENPIGFFLHIPFPPPEILTALPRAHTLVRALFSFDLVGFQTDSDRSSFVRFATDELHGRDLGEGRVSVNNQATTAGAFAIGINGESFADMARSDEAVQQETRLKRILLDRSQIIGVDRLDYTKGLVQRFLAFERLLEDYPANRGRVSLMQIAPPSRGELDAYADLRRQL
ncbi:MAG: trehalose-6-phosphate synthase, partial [Pseudomonadota bacterium]|nr:trehalose-6-phosphate synthase [Pseudomonadota bacterium]